MAGTKEGGLKAAATNKKKYGKNFYAQIGARGGRNGHCGGFNSDKVGQDGLTGWERAKVVGKTGGTKSTRLGVKNGQGKKRKYIKIVEIKPRGELTVKVRRAYDAIQEYGNKWQKQKSED